MLNFKSKLDKVPFWYYVLVVVLVSVFLFCSLTVNLPSDSAYNCSDNSTVLKTRVSDSLRDSSSDGSYNFLSSTMYYPIAVTDGSFGNYNTFVASSLDPLTIGFLGFGFYAQSVNNASGGIDRSKMAIKFNSYLGFPFYYRDNTLREGMNYYYFNNDWDMPLYRLNTKLNFSSGNFIEFTQEETHAIIGFETWGDTYSYASTMFIYFDAAYDFSKAVALRIGTFGVGDPWDSYPFYTDLQRLGYTAYIYQQYLTSDSKSFYILIPTTLSSHGYVTSREYMLDGGFDILQESSYKDGYLAGYDVGHNAGFATGKNDGYQSGYKNGQTFGYDKGFSEGVNSANSYSFFGLMASVVDAPIQAFSGLFDFEVFGFNMKTFFFSLFTICVIVFVIKKLGFGS